MNSLEMLGFIDSKSPGAHLFELGEQLPFGFDGIACKSGKFDPLKCVRQFVVW